MDDELLEQLPALELPEVGSSLEVEVCELSSPSRLFLNHREGCTGPMMVAMEEQYGTAGGRAGLEVGAGRVVLGMVAAAAWALGPGWYSRVILLNTKVKIKVFP